MIINLQRTATTLMAIIWQINLKHKIHKTLLFSITREKENKLYLRNDLVKVSRYLAIDFNCQLFNRKQQQQQQ